MKLRLGAKQISSQREFALRITHTRPALVVSAAPAGNGSGLI
jgi:hypothetical protein